LVGPSPARAASADVRFLAASQVSPQLRSGGRGGPKRRRRCRRYRPQGADGGLPTSLLCRTQPGCCAGSRTSGSPRRQGGDGPPRTGRPGHRGRVKVPRLTAERGVNVDCVPPSNIVRNGKSPAGDEPRWGFCLTDSRRLRLEASPVALGRSPHSAESLVPVRPSIGSGSSPADWPDSSDSLLVSVRLPSMTAASGLAVESRASFLFVCTSLRESWPFASPIA
jgi:hypothetical protein